MAIPVGILYIFAVHDLGFIVPTLAMMLFSGYGLLIYSIIRDEKKA